MPVTTLPSPPPAAASQTSPAALISLILSILGWVSLPIGWFLFPLICVPVVLAISAVVTGHIALPQIARSVGAVTGRGLAVAGLVLGYGLVFVGLVLPLCATVLLFVLALLGPAIGDVFSNIVLNI
jgi:hypothetical protein